jgi:hypothetical protein
MSMTMLATRLMETTTRPGQGTILARLEPAERPSLEKLEHESLERVVSASIDHEAEPVALRAGERVLWVRPIDTRLFVRAMAPHVCFN